MGNIHLLNNNKLRNKLIKIPVEDKKENVIHVITYVSDSQRNLYT